eukprot:gene2214-1379_t
MKVIVRAPLTIPIERERDMYSPPPPLTPPVLSCALLLEGDRIIITIQQKYNGCKNKNKNNVNNNGGAVSISLTRSMSCDLEIRLLRCQMDVVVGEHKYMRYACRANNSLTGPDEGTSPPLYTDPNDRPKCPTANADSP